MSRDNPADFSNVRRCRPSRRGTQPGFMSSFRQPYVYSLPPYTYAVAPFSGAGGQGARSLHAVGSCFGRQRPHETFSPRTLARPLDHGSAPGSGARSAMATPAQRLHRYRHTPARTPDWAGSRHVYRPRRPTATPLYPVVPSGHAPDARFYARRAPRYPSPSPGDPVGVTSGTSLPPRKTD